jgi:hypothetical protein
MSKCHWCFRRISEAGLYCLPFCSFNCMAQWTLRRKTIEKAVTRIEVTPNGTRKDPIQ